MMYNNNYQLLVAKGALVNSGASGLRSMSVGDVAIVDETSDDTAASAISSWSGVKKFSLYQKTRNDKGKVVIIKHSGNQPIVVDAIKNKSYKAYSAGVGQYWQVVFPSSFDACCQDYTIQFSISNENIYKSQFPNYLMQEISVDKKCCESMCSNDTDPFSRYELAFALWREVALNKDGYLRAHLVYEKSDALKAGFTKYDDNGNASIYFEYYASSAKHVVEASLDTYANGKITYTDTNVTANPNTSTSATVSIDDLFAYVVSKLSLTTADDIAVVFELSPEDKNTSAGKIDLKYNVLRNTTAKIDFKGGFECNDGYTFKNNMDSASSGIYIGAVTYDTDDSAYVYGEQVGKFAYPVGDGYDVWNMETYDSRRTLNSPYAFSDYTFTESGINYRSEMDKHYNMVTIGYEQDSEALCGNIRYAHGTTIAIDSTVDITTNTTAWYGLLHTLLGLT